MKGNVYKDYTGETFEYSYPYSFDERNKEYLKMKLSPLGTWNYGEAITISFHLKHEEVAQKIGKDPSAGKLVLTMFNFRLEKVYSSDPISYIDNPVFTISSELSKKIFKKGIYYCMLTYVDDSSLDEYVVLLNTNNSFFYVE